LGEIAWRHAGWQRVGDTAGFALLPNMQFRSWCQLAAVPGYRDHFGQELGELRQCGISEGCGEVLADIVASEGGGLW
jgi:hypothetical protein